ncbi:hypothetical protein GCM10027519_41170 [Kineococcus endophyticus]
MVSLGLDDVVELELDELDMESLGALPAVSSEPPQAETPSPRAPTSARAENVRLPVEVIIIVAHSSLCARATFARARRPATLASSCSLVADAPSSPLLRCCSGDGLV